MFRTLTAPDGTEHRFRIPIDRRRDAVYCSNACRQAAYRIRKANRERAARTLRGGSPPHRKSVEP
jgi:hypothetical protein